MRRRDFIAALAAVLSSAGMGRAQDKVPRLGYLWIGAAGSDGATLGGLRRGLAELGYVEGRTISVERRYANGHPDRLAALAAELVALPVDVLLAPGTLTTRAMQKATTTIPIVSTTGDPVGSRFVDSLARPGGNITGLSLGSSEAFAGKWLELLKEAVPGLTRVAVLHDSRNTSTGRQLPVIEQAAPQLGVALVPIAAGTGEELDPALSQVVASGAGALIVTDDPLFAEARQRLIDFAREHRLPAMYGLGEFVENGGLMSYSSSVFDIWRRAARYADRVLKGERPAEMPVEQPTAFELKINVRSAEALGLALPHSLLLRADEVLE
jgi:putative ABC transport system substrate-binding protein